MEGGGGMKTGGGDRRDSSRMWMEGGRGRGRGRGPEGGRKRRRRRRGIIENTVSGNGATKKRGGGECAVSERALFNVAPSSIGKREEAKPGETEGLGVVCGKAVRGARRRRFVGWLIRWGAGAGAAAFAVVPFSCFFFFLLCKARSGKQQ